MAADASATRGAARIRSFPYRRALARLGFRARGLSRCAALATEPCRVARSPPLLRRLPRRRRSARRVARRAIEACDGRRADGCDAVAVQPISAPHREAPLRESTWLRAVICHSRMVRDEIHQRFSVPDSKLHVIHNPVDGDIFHPGLREERATVVLRHGIDAASTIFLLAATDFARADLGTTIDAFAQRRAKGAPYRGGRRQRGRALSRAGTGAGRRRSRDARRLATSTGDPITARPTCSCCPRSTIPRPTSRSKPWRAHLPVITSTKSGAALLLQEGDCGLVCPSGDVAALAAHMRRCRTRRHALVLPATRGARCCRSRRRRSRLQQVLLYRDLLATPAPPTLDTAIAGAPARDRSGG